MARKEPAKGVHTSPAKAGAHNLKNVKQGTEKDESLAPLIEIFKRTVAKPKDYQGLWTEESFTQEVAEYFDFMRDHDVKPSKSSLALWLGCHRSQYYDWETLPEKHGYKTDVVRYANSLMEASYITKGEKFPTFNMFLLRTSHGHVEKNVVEVTGNMTTSADEVKDLVGKLGLDKSK